MNQITIVEPNNNSCREKIVNPRYLNPRYLNPIISNSYTVCPSGHPSDNSCIKPLYICRSSMSRNEWDIEMWVFVIKMKSFFIQQWAILFLYFVAYKYHAGYLYFVGF